VLALASRRGPRGGRFGKSRRLLQFPPYFAQRLEQLAFLVDSIRMKIVQFLEAQAGKCGARTSQHFLEIVAIDFHGLATRG
jgi:hypothetical protein